MHSGVPLLRVHDYSVYVHITLNVLIVLIQLPNIVCLFWNVCFQFLRGASTSLLYQKTCHACAMCMQECHTHHET